MFCVISCDITFNDINNITQSDVDNFDFDNLNWQASGTDEILIRAISESEDGVISLSSVEEKIEDSIRESLYNLPFLQTSSMLNFCLTLSLIY